MTAQKYLHFTYDDVPTTLGPCIVRNIRTAAYSYSVYFNEAGSDADWEMYDLGVDPDEMHNVAGTLASGCAQLALDNELVTLMQKNGTQPSFQWPPQQTADSVGGPPAIGEYESASALSEEISTLVTAGNASVDRLAEILYGSDTPPHLIVRAARGLARLDTREAHAALQQALYGAASWPRSVTAQVHRAMALRRKT